MEITAHAGMDGTSPNSRENLKAAILSDADIIEVDVRRNAQGVLYLFHDVLTKPFLEETIDQRLTLDEAFDSIAGSGNKKINCDLKEPGLESHVHQLAREYGLQNRLIYTGTVQFPEEEMTWQSDVKVFYNLEHLLSSYSENTSYKNNVQESEENSIKRAAETMWKNPPIGLVGWNVEVGVYLRNRSWFIEQGVPLSLWTVDEKETLETLFREHEAIIVNITTRQVAMAEKIREAIERDFSTHFQ